MRLATLAVFLVGIAIPIVTLAEKKHLTLKVGDRVMVSMKGKLANRYDGLVYVHVETHDSTMKGGQAKIVQVLKDGRYRIDNLMEVQEKGKQPYLVTYSAVIEASELKPRIANSNSPDDIFLASVVSEQDQHLLRVELSDLNEVRLRSWKLDEEILQ